MAGILDAIEGTFANPLFLAGAGLASGEGFGGAMQGYKLGMSSQENRLQQQRQAELQRLLASSQGFGGAPQGLIDIARVTRDAAPLTQYMIKQADAGRTDDIKEYEYARQRGFQGSLQDWMVNKRTSSGEYNKTPLYGTRIGPNGQPETVMLQAGSRGDAVATKLPEGVSVNAQKPIEIDGGTHTVLLDPITRQPIAQVPKNLAEANREKEIGTGQGQARVNLPGVESTSQATIRYIDDVLNDPNLERVVGTFGGATPNITPGARSAQAKIEQLKGRSFLEAFQALKGAGAITEMEGAKASYALTRLQDQMQSGKDYRAALTDFKNEVYRLTELARRKAGVGGPNGNAGFAGTAPQSQRRRYNPQTGEIE